MCPSVPLTKVARQGYSYFAKAFERLSELSEVLGAHTTAGIDKGIYIFQTGAVGGLSPVTKSFQFAKGRLSKFTSLP